jgi:GNAT superfamily N-acetyltransferase
LKATLKKIVGSMKNCVEHSVRFEKLLFYTAKLDQISSFSQTVPIIKYQASELPGIVLRFNPLIARYVTQAKAGVDFFAAKSEDIFIGELLGHAGSCYIKGVGIAMDLQPDEVYLYWSHVSEKHRRKGIYRSLMSAAHKYYATNGYSISVALVFPDNYAVVRYLTSVGYSLEKTFYVLVLLNMKIGITFPFVNIRNSIFMRINPPKDYFTI